MPDVSVIVPVYKVEPYLRRCVDSILAQTFTDFELILVDDGSPDNCGAICDKYAEEDRRVIVLHTPNYGPASARNMALDIEKGAYILFVDADDYVHPRMLELLVSAIKESGVDIVRFNFEKGNISDYAWCNNEPVYEILSSREYLRTSILNNSNGIWVLWDKLYKKECFNTIRMPEGRFYEDNATVYKVLYESTSIAVTDAAFYYYYQQKDSITNQGFSEKRLDWITVLDEMIVFFSDRNDEEVTERLVRRYLSEAPRNYQKLCEVCPESGRLLQLRERIAFYFKTYKSKLGLNIKNSVLVYKVLYPDLMHLISKANSLRKRWNHLLRR